MDRQRKQDGPQGKKTHRYTREAGDYRGRNAKESAGGYDGVSMKRAGKLAGKRGRNRV